MVTTTLISLVVHLQNILGRFQGMYSWPQFAHHSRDENQSLYIIESHEFWKILSKKYL